MKLLSWNINGLESLSIASLIKDTEADILCFQEVKSSRNKLLNAQLACIPGFDAFFHFAARSNYSSVATFVRQAFTPVDACDRFPFVMDDLPPKLINAMESEGRFLMTDHGSWILLNVTTRALVHL